MNLTLPLCLILSVVACASCDSSTRDLVCAIPDGRADTQGEINDLEGCTTIDGQIRSDADEDTDLRPLEAMRALNGSLRLEVAFEFLQVESIRDGLTVTRTNSTDLSGLDALESVGEPIFVVENPQLTSLVGLRSLRTIGGEFFVRCNVLLDESEVVAVEERIGVDIAFDPGCPQK